MNRPELYFMLLCSFLFVACGEKTPQGFSSIEELKEAFRSSYEEGDVEGLMDLVYWDDTPDTIKVTYKAILSMGSGDHSLNNLEVLPIHRLKYPENTLGKEVELVITPTHWLAGTFSGNTGYKGALTTGTFQFAVGQVGERYYLSGIRFASDSSRSGEESDLSKTDKPTVAEYFDDGSWTPTLNREQRLLKIVTLSPGEVRPIEGVIMSPGIYGIRVKEGWDLKERKDSDGKDYWVYLRSPSSSPQNPNQVGTTYGASNRFTPGEGIKYELANETPLSVTVAIYTEIPEEDSQE